MMEDVALPESYSSSFPLIPLPVSPFLALLSALVCFAYPFSCCFCILASVLSCWVANFCSSFCSRTCSLSFAGWRFSACCSSIPRSLSTFSRCLEASSDCSCVQRRRRHALKQADREIPLHENKSSTELSSVPEGRETVKPTSKTTSLMRMQNRSSCCFQPSND